MIRLHRHSDAGARMGADSPDPVVAPVEERLSPPEGLPPLPPTVAVATPPMALRSSCEEDVEGAGSVEGVGSVEVVGSEGVGPEAALVWSAFTRGETKHERGRR